MWLDVTLLDLNPEAFPGLKMPLPFLVPAILALAPPATPPLAQITPILPTQRAIDLLKDGKVGEALDQLNKAIARDPKDGQPLWIKAQVYRELANQTKGWPAAWYRECAEEAGEAMLEVPGLERNAAANIMAFLQHLRDDERPVPPEPTQAAVKAFNAGEIAFAKGAWVEARAGYGLALKESPTFALAALDMGDTYFSEQRMEEAIQWFRKATELNPAEPRAWRYMADAQVKLGQVKAAEATMISAIRIFPANRTSWRPLAQHRESQGRRMTRLAFTPGVNVGWNKDGSQTIGLNESPSDPQAQNAWFLLSTAILDNISVSTTGDTKPEDVLKTRFQQERFYWNVALQAYADGCQKAKVEPKDPVLRQFINFQKDGQLDAAIFLLRYREAFRPDYEAWQKANPAAIEAFLNRYNIRP